MFCKQSTVVSEHQVLACITEVDNAWRLLAEAVEQASSRKASLRLVVCQTFIKDHTKDDFAHFFRKLRHAATQSCKDSDVRLIIEILDCGMREQVEVEKLISEKTTDLVILSDLTPNSFIGRLLPRRSAQLARSCKCSVLLVR